MLRRNGTKAIVTTSLAIMVELVALCGCVPQSPVASQQATTDPQALLDQLVRDTEEDRQRERAEKAQERIRLQQEQAYDRDMCLKAGKTGPDVDQCVRDSALFRRQGSLPTGKRSEPTDPVVQCTTIDNNDGTHDTDCF
jgi:hypothetical protein